MTARDGSESGWYVDWWSAACPYLVQWRRTATTATSRHTPITASFAWWLVLLLAGAIPARSVQTEG